MNVGTDQRKSWFIGMEMENEMGLQSVMLVQRWLTGLKTTTPNYFVRWKAFDCGGKQYFDEYAQADTRQALIEAREQGIIPFA